MRYEKSVMEEWLRRFKWALTEIPCPERDDILAEVTGHILDSTQGGVPTESVLEQFGSPEGYARNFIDQMNASRVQGSQAAATQMSFVLSHANRNMIAAGSALCLSFIGAVLFVCVVMSLLKLWDPSHVGLWRHGKAVFLGKIDNPAMADDLLGNWFYLFFFGISAASCWVGRILLARSVNGIVESQHRTNERNI